MQSGPSEGEDRSEGAGSRRRPQLALVAAALLACLALGVYAVWPEAAPTPPTPTPSPAPTPAPPSPAAPTPQEPAVPAAPPELALTLTITGLGVTNPDEICDALGAGQWLESTKALVGCGEELLLVRFEEALVRSLGEFIPGVLPLPDPRLRVSLVRIRLTRDGFLRVRAVVTTPEVEAPSWRLQAAFQLDAPADFELLPGSPLRLETAVFSHPDVCRWSEAEGLSLCEFYSRFVPTLIKSLPAGPTWVLESVAWSEENTVRATLRGFTRRGPKERIVFLTRDADPLPHWTVAQ